MIEKETFEYFIINVPFRLRKDDIDFLKDVKREMGTVAAIRVLRFKINSLGLMESKNFIDSL